MEIHDDNEETMPSDQDAEDEEAKFELGDEDESERHDYDWIETLQDSRVDLTLLSVRTFIASFQDASPSITKNEFLLRLTKFLDPEVSLRQKMPPLTSDLKDFLFDAAVEATKQLKAWERTVERVKSQEFKETQVYLQQEIEHFRNVLRLLRQNTKQAPPDWLLPCRRIWIKSVQDHVEDIIWSLQGVKKYLQGLSKLSVLGRTTIESHLILLAKEGLLEKINGSPFERQSSLLLAALAYAAELVPYVENENSDYVGTVKTRVSRAERSKQHLTALGVSLMSRLVDFGQEGR